MKKTLSLILALVMVATMFAVITVPASAAVEFKTNASVYDGTMDKSWYNAEATEFTLYTAAQLAGLADLVNTDGVKFEGVTIKLGADIIWNEGTFALGFDKKTPVYNGGYVPETINVWPVIGARSAGSNSQKAGDNMFYGNFDGQGHVVSGLYINTDNAYAGFFSVFCGEYIKNLSIINSFFGCNSRTGAFAGFVTNGDKKDVSFENLYTDAIIVNVKADGNARTGGIFGMQRYVNNITMNNIWFDGVLSILGSDATKTTPFVGGLVGVICEENDGEVVNFTNCLVTGTINAQVAADATNVAFGGLVANIYTNERTAPVVVNVKNCLVAVESTNLVVSETLSQVARSAFIGRFEKSYATYTVENSYFVPQGVFGTGNTVSSVVAGWGAHEYVDPDFKNDKKADTLTDITFNGNLIAEASKLPETEVVATAKIEKIADATGLSTEVFDLTGETAALKTVTTKIEAPVDVWDGTADTTWFDPANVAEEYVLTTAEQLAGLAKLVDEAPASSQPFKGVTIKLGANMVLNEGTFALGFDKKTPVYNGNYVPENINVWNPIGVSYAGGNECDVYANASFWGAFDGQGFVISGMYVNNPETQQQGLFGTFAGTSIKNVVITNSYVCGESRVGSLVGFISNNNKSNEDKSAGGDTSAPATHDVLIENIYSDAIVVGNYKADDFRIGGIVGISRRVKALTFKNLTFEGITSAVGAADGVKARNYGGVIGVIVDDKADGTIYENIVNKGAMYADVANADAQFGALVGNHCFGNFTMTNCVVDLADTNITIANGFASEHAIKDEAGAVTGYDLKGTTTAYAALIGAIEKATTIATIENCTWTHNGLFIDATGDFHKDCEATINGKTRSEWLAEGGVAVAGGTHGGFVAAKDATCEEAGNLAHYNCSCGVVLDANGVETTLEAVTLAPDHNYGEWIAPVDPTATEAGVLGHFECSICHKYFDSDKIEMESIVGDPATGTPADTGAQPGTDAPGTDAPGTDAPGTDAPGTDAPGTDAPATNAPATNAPSNKTEEPKKKGCGGFTAAGAIVALVAVMGAAIVIKKK